MKKFLLIPVLCVLSACTSSKPLDMNKVASLYYGQQRSAKLLELRHVSDVHIKGSNMTFAVSSQLQPLNILPRDPSTAQAIAETAGRVLVAGVGIVTAGQVMSKLAERPQVISQQVVQPQVVEPTVVRPEVVTVPAAQ